MPLPVECVARGYLSGSGWKDYQKTGAVCGDPAAARPARVGPAAQPIFTPATKAESGHDENISEAEAGDIVGAERIARLRDLTLAIYAARRRARRDLRHHHRRHEVRIRARRADAAKPEGGDELVLIDEVLTPDSSRFWPKDDYRPGQGQPSFDKQFVRDYLEQIGWNKQPPVPSLPDDVVMRTREKYLEAYQRLTGQRSDVGTGRAGNRLTGPA